MNHEDLTPDEKEQIRQDYPNQHGTGGGGDKLESTGRAILEPFRKNTPLSDFDLFNTRPMRDWAVPDTHIKGVVEDLLEHFKLHMRQQK